MQPGCEIGYELKSVIHNLDDDDKTAFFNLVVIWD